VPDRAVALTLLPELMMFGAIKRLFVTRTDDDLLNDAEKAAGSEPIAAVRRRHADLEERVRKATAGMDPATLVMLLIQVFGPTLVKVIERWLAKRASQTA
jgi:hypothetical protein